MRLSVYTESACERATKGRDKHAAAQTVFVFDAFNVT